MPFVPLTPEEEKAFGPQCRDPEHNPPSMMVISRPMKWRCPSCGSETVMMPSTVYCYGPSIQPRWHSVPSAGGSIFVTPEQPTLEAWI